MTEEAKQARKEYKKQWNKNHPDKLKQYAAKYWERKAQQAADKQEV